MTGDLIAGFVQLISAKRQQAQNTAQHLGQDTMTGLVQGMKSQQPKVTQTADDAADSVAEAIRASLDIHSPSRVMEYLGRMAGLGFVTGLKSLRDDALRASRELATAARSVPERTPGPPVWPLSPEAGSAGASVENTAAALAALTPSWPRTPWLPRGPRRPKWPLGRPWKGSARRSAGRRSTSGACGTRSRSRTPPLSRWP
ncbi:hypothetical protein CTI14_28490 [Methylobacterium radiotolerans]|nr:hypothetical protein CTI14_28490 [Methylobacterium radiotolerans]